MQTTVLDSQDQSVRGARPGDASLAKLPSHNLTREVHCCVEYFHTFDQIYVSLAQGCTEDFNSLIPSSLQLQKAAAYYVAEARVESDLEGDTFFCLFEASPGA